VGAARDPGSDRSAALSAGPARVSPRGSAAARGTATAQHGSAATRRVRQPSYFGRARRWLRPPRRLRPTRAGWIFFVLVFGIGFAALNTGNNLLYLVLALMLAFLVLSGVLSEAALRGIEVRRRIPRELFAACDNPIALEIRNAQRRVAAMAVVIEDRLALDEEGPETAGGRVFALRVGAGDTEMRSYRLHLPRRGPVDFRGFVVSTRFPFGLFSKALVIEAPERALVYPAVEPVELPADFGGARRSGAQVQGPRGSGSDASGLREFAPGDSMRRIHWRSSVRTGVLLVREVESEHEAEVEVQLRTAGEAAGDGFERRVAWSASEVVALLDAGLRVALRTDGCRIPADSGTGQRARLLAFLALVQPAAPAAEAP
jgi:uncharacterized protein (DUF58 family)